MFIITHIDKFFHNSPSAARYLGTPHFTGTFLSFHMQTCALCPKGFYFNLLSYTIKTRMEVSLHPAFPILHILPAPAALYAGSLR